MQEVVWQDGNSIEISLWDTLTVEEFKQVVHQLESLCTAHPKINVMIDAGGLDGTEKGIISEQYDFFKNYKDHLERVAVVTDNRFEQFFTSMFNLFTDVEIKVFPNKKTDDAVAWIFPSRLP